MKRAICAAALAVACLSVPARAEDFTQSYTDQDSLDAIAWARQGYNGQMDGGARLNGQPTVDTDQDFIALIVRQQVAKWITAKLTADAEAAIAAALAGNRVPAEQLLDKYAPQP